MNPYQPNQYAYPQQGYQYAPQAQQQYQQPQFNIQAMYSSVQPYNDKEFLLNTFGNKVDFIRVFLTLSHEDKLMLYMLTEEKKIYGEIRDKQNYQRLLKEIAQKVHNYNLFYHGDHSQSSKEQNKEKDLEHRIDDFVEKTFEKLHLASNNTPQKRSQQQLPSLPDEQEEEWVDSIQQPYPEFKQSKSSIQRRERQLNDQKQNLRNMEANTYKLPAFESYSAHNLGNHFTSSSMNVSIEKKSIWDLDIQQDELSQREPNIRQIFKGSKQSNMANEERDSYDMEADMNGNFMNRQKADNSAFDYRYSYDPTHAFAESQKCMKVNKNSSMGQHENQLTSSDNGYNLFKKQNVRNYDQPNPQNFQDIFSNTLGTSYNQYNQGYEQNDAMITQDKKEDCYNFNYANTQMNAFQLQQNLQETTENNNKEAINIGDDEWDSDFQSAEVVTEQVGSTSNQIESKTENQNEQNPPFIDSNKENEAVQKKEVLLKPHEINYTNEFQSLFLSQSSSKSPATQDYNMDFLESIGTTPKLQQYSSMKQENAKLEQVKQNDKVQEAEQDDFDYYQQAETVEHNNQSQKKQNNNDFVEGFNQPLQIPTENNQHNVQNNQQNGYHKQQYQNSFHDNSKQADSQSFQPTQKISSSFITVSDSKKYVILDQLKIEMSHEDRQYVQKQLQSKGYECDGQFYQKVINYLRTINMENSRQIAHLNEQYNLVKKLHEQSVRYTTAVNEDEEDLIFASIKVSKSLMNQIYEKSSQTEEIVNALLNKDHIEKGYLYKLGRVLVDMGVKNELLTKVISPDNLTQTQNSFYVLYILDKLNTLQGLQHHTERIMQYTNKQYEKYKFLDSDILAELQQDPEQYPAYKLFIKGFVKLLCICERMMTVLKTCGMKSQTNMVKTLKICKDMKAKYSSYRDSQTSALLPDRYKQVLKQSVSRNRSLYEMHSDFVGVCDQVPVCSMCLISIGTDGQRFQNQRYCHYSCFNLLVELEKSSSS